MHKYILEPENYKYLVLDYTIPQSKQQKDFCKAYASYKKGKEDEKLIRAYKEVYVAKGNTKNTLTKAVELKNKYKNYIKYLKLKHVYDFIWSTEEDKYMKRLYNIVTNHRIARELLSSNNMFDEDHIIDENEFEIYWKYGSPGIECKSKLDRLIIDRMDKKVRLIDLKTTSHLNEFKTTSFIQFKYYRQMAFYIQAIQWYIFNVLKEDPHDYNYEVYIIAISKKEPIEVKVFKVSDKLLKLGNTEIESLMKQLKYHFDTNNWQYDKSYYEGTGIEIIE